MSFVQSDFYDVETIKTRLSQALSTEEWENIKQTDLGQALLAFGANVIHQEAMAFYTGFDQFFKSTVTLKGYLEALAKSSGVVPKTFSSASLSLTLTASQNRTYGPLDFSAEVSGTRFFNLSDITISTSPTTIVLYEGVVVREASSAGITPFYSWSYSQMSAPISVLVGSQVIRKYVVLPDNIFLISLIVESTPALNIVPVRWIKVDSWFDQTAISKAYVLEKDYLGRYKVVFGDGIYGLPYPSSEIVIVRYLLSQGANVSISDYNTSNIKIYNQDFSEITSLFTVSSSSTFSPGFSEINFDDLKLEIEQKQSSRDVLVRLEEYENYLIGRSDVLAAVVIAERDADPPNVEYFNTVRYACKPTVEGVLFNNTDIQNYFSRYGLETVDFMKTDPLIGLFNVQILVTALPGYSIGTVVASVTSILTDAFSWNSLGFQEKLTTSRIYNLLAGIEGINLASLEITVYPIYTDTTTGVIEFDYTNANVIYLPFIPRRYKIFVECDEFGPIANRRDNGMGYIYGDFVGEERLTNTNVTAPNFLNISNMLFICNGSTTGRLIDLRNSQGATSSLTFSNNVFGIAWDSYYKRLISVESNTGTYYIRTMPLPNEVFDPEGYTYLQLNPIVPLTSHTIDFNVTPPANTDGVSAIVYYGFYIYILWHLSSGNHRIVRYRVTQSAIDTADALWGNGSGYIETSTKDYYGGAVIENIFYDEDVLFLASESGIDAIRDFNTIIPSYQSDFFNDATKYVGISADNVNKALYVTVSMAYDVTEKITAISVSGTGTVRVLSNGSIVNLVGGALVTSNDEIKYYVCSTSRHIVCSSNYDDSGEPMVLRAGQNGSAGTTNSIQELAVVNYPIKQIDFSKSVTNCKVYFVPEDEVEYVGFQMPILNLLSVAELT